MPSEKKTSSASIALAWILVCAPLAWGVYNTALGAARLFTHLHQNPPAQMKTS